MGELTFKTSCIEPRAAGARRFLLVEPQRHKDHEEDGIAMGDLKDARLIYFKGFLFLVSGCLAGAGLLIESPTVRTAFLLGIAIWSFCRLYYFMFYVIEKYVDGSYRFA